MAAGASSIAATSTAVPASPAAPGLGGRLPGPVLISGQPIPATGYRQPHRRLRWWEATATFRDRIARGKALRLATATSLISLPLENPGGHRHDEWPRPGIRERGERRSTHGWSTRGLPSPRTDVVRRGSNF